MQQINIILVTVTAGLSNKWQKKLRLRLVLRKGAICNTDKQMRRKISREQEFSNQTAADEVENKG
jgi:hypothetical protein